MNKDEIEKALHILSMVTGDCPFERDIGEAGDAQCEKYSNCVDCWKRELYKELKHQTN